jgi:hypothetical protein
VRDNFTSTRKINNDLTFGFPIYLMNHLYPLGTFPLDQVYSVDVSSLVATRTPSPSRVPSIALSVDLLSTQPLSLSVSGSTYQVHQHHHQRGGGIEVAPPASTVVRHSRKDSGDSGPLEIHDLKDEKSRHSSSSSLSSSSFSSTLSPAHSINDSSPDVKMRQSLPQRNLTYGEDRYYRHQSSNVMHLGTLRVRKNVRYSDRGVLEA